MAGICGIVKKSTFSDNSIKQLIENMLLNESLTTANIFAENEIEISEVELKKYLLEPYESENYVVYFCGAIYNIEEVKNKFKFLSSNILEIIANAENKGVLKEILHDINGEFSGCIYDKVNKILKLFTDRMGTNFIYYYLKDGNFAFADNVNSLVNLKNADKTIDENILKNFVGTGFMFGDHSWYKYIKLIKPSSIIEFNLNTSEFKQYYYWKFSEIKKQKISYKNAAKKLGKLFIKSVEKRLPHHKEICVPTSGGCDSRMIVAAINKINPRLKTFNYTFGTDDCQDIQIAKAVCSVAGQKHTNYLFDYGENWINKRFQGLIENSGSFSIKHMHGWEIFPKLGEMCSSSFTGYPAGEILYDLANGASRYLDMRINKDIVGNIFKSYENLADDVDDDYYNIESCVPYIYMNRIRRFGNQNIFALNSHFKSVYPFLDNEVVEFIFSLPEEYIINHIYRKALYMTFPKFYKTIPWQRTGKTIDQEYAKHTKRNKIIEKLKQLKERLARKSKTDEPKPAYFFNYKEGIKKENVANLLKGLLDPEKSKLSKINNENYIEKYLKPHLENSSVDYSERILEIASFELYFKNSENSK